MHRKQILEALTEQCTAAVRRTGEALDQKNLEGESSYEVWNGADAITHCAEWLEIDRKRMDNPDEVIPIMQPGDLERINRGFYDEHRGTSWGEAKSMLTRTVASIYQKIDAMGDAGLNRTLSYSDGRQRPLWWGLAGHLGLHVGWHLGIILRRGHQTELSVSLVKDFVDSSVKLSDDPKWLSANHYDLAVAYAQARRPLDAIAELDKSFSLYPQNRKIAVEDEDLEPLWERDDFKQLADR
jgi:hypothetical protein